MNPTQPNTVQKHFRENVRNLGLGQIVHHATDRTMKIKGVGNIGHWFLVPCSSDEDHRSIHAAGHDRKRAEKTRYAAMCAVYKHVHGELPLPDGVYQAIMEFRR